MYYEQHKKNYLGTTLILILLLIIIVILINLITKVDAKTTKDLIISEEAGTDTVLNNFNVENLVTNTSYSVVGISKIMQNDTSIFVENSEEKLGIGSGIIITSDGFILTNYSLSGDIKSTCYATLKNGDVYPGEVIWVNKNLDISIIKIAAENLLSLSLGDSEKCSLGEMIYMVSNPSGYSFKEELNTGVIRSLKNTIKIIEDEDEIYVEDIMKIDNNILSSQTGSPVLNKNGEVIGISSSKINAIIPINRIKNIIERLKEDGEFKEAYLGVYGFDNDVLKYLNLDYTSAVGVYIEKILEDSPVFEKMEKGDILTKIDDYEISTMQELSEYLYLKNPKDKVLLKVIRGTKEMDIECILK